MHSQSLISLLLLGASLTSALPVTPRSPQDSNTDAFSQMLDQQSELQQQTMLENMEMQKAQALGNPLESMSKEDATSKKQKREAQDAFSQTLDQYNELQQQAAEQNMEIQMAQAAANSAPSASKQVATTKKEKREAQDAFSQTLDQYNELQQQAAELNMEIQMAQAAANSAPSTSKVDAVS